MALSGRRRIVSYGYISLKEIGKCVCKNTRLLLRLLILEALAESLAVTLHGLQFRLALKCGWRR